jgi:F0F1-type ATP synthase assembly protein I
MKNFVNDYIEKEKKKMPSPFLAERVMQRISEINEQEIEKSKKMWWQGVAVAASFAAVIMMGVALGNSYQVKTPSQTILVVDDRYIEHLYIFKNQKDG